MNEYTQWVCVCVSAFPLYAPKIISRRRWHQRFTSNRFVFYVIPEWLKARAVRPLDARQNRFVCIRHFFFSFLSVSDGCHFGGFHRTVCFSNYFSVFVGCAQKRRVKRVWVKRISNSHGWWFDTIIKNKWHIRNCLKNWLTERLACVGSQAPICKRRRVCGCLFFCWKRRASCKPNRGNAYREKSRWKIFLYNCAFEHRVRVMLCLRAHDVTALHKYE